MWIDEGFFRERMSNLRFPAKAGRTSRDFRESRARLKDTGMLGSVFVHLHPVKVRKSGIRMRYTTSPAPVAVTAINRRHGHQWIKRLHQSDCVTGNVNAAIS